MRIKRDFEPGGSPYSVEADIGARTLALLPGTAATSHGNSEFIDSDSGQAVTIERVCKSVRSGWHPMLRDLLWRMIEAGWDGRIAQVKEKMGCLWVYIDQDRHDLERMVTPAGERSTFTCEVCGAKPPRNMDGSATVWRCEGCAPRTVRCPSTSRRAELLPAMRGNPMPRSAPLWSATFADVASRFQ
jgi:hypothetical protein